MRFSRLVVCRCAAVFSSASLALSAGISPAMAGETPTLTGGAATQTSAAPSPDATPATTTPSAATGGGSGTAVPRFVSLKSDRVNLRAGPGTEYPASWVFRRAGLPVEIIKEFDAWRQVRDADGVSGWVLQSFLSGRRTALVLPWEAKAETPPQTAVHSDDSEGSRAVAMVEAGVIANVHTCDGRWCDVSMDDVRGYIAQKKLWGVYDGEKVK
ncbi:MAG: SH3 domain-containing protein [Hyphomicrobium sp.]